MSRSLKWVRRNYNVPAFTGLTVTYQGQPAVVMGGHRQYVRVLHAGKKRAAVVHPLDLRYPAVPLPPRPRGWCWHCLEERSLRLDGTVVRHLRNGHEHFPVVQRLCPGALDTPWAVCSWTIPAATEEAAA
ncbi:hypothetical protein ACIO6U_03025 [Streptomyces sp. NPDC087422]|uniref:hypothetical protein n=1 Tax=Streptomyces sp. NPDC087422 TaxID=3365786 RepID=UPI003828A2CD